MKKENIIKAKKCLGSATIGIFTPSTPANVMFPEKYEHGLKQLRESGFNVIEGFLTARKLREGYRTASPELRAKEFMELVELDTVDILMSTIGGYNSSSLIPYLNFDVIRRKRKMLTGYSDVTALHMAILTQAGLSTFYGPAVVPSFGEHPCVLPKTLESFRCAIEGRSEGVVLTPFEKWSCEFRDASTDAWKTGERKYLDNTGWKTLRSGEAKAPLIVANMNTLTSIAGSPYFPKFDGEILLIEEMSAKMAEQERNIRQLELMGVFDNISGLIIGKPESFSRQAAPFSYEDLFLEIIGQREYPIISNFDCGHTHPMFTLAQMTDISLKATKESVEFKILENMVE